MATVNYFDWNMGVNDETLHKGIIKNTNYINGSGEKKYFSGDQEFSFSEDDDPIKNYQSLEGYLLPQGNNLEVKIISSTGNDTYTIKDCYDIKYVARYLVSNIESIISNSEIKISYGPAIAISNYDSRFSSNNLGGILACQITNTSTNDKYLRSFTISGQNITLKSINPDSNGIYQIDSIAGISANWKFELISAFDIVKAGTELETVFQGYVIKTIENGEGTIKFTKFDTPLKLLNESIVIVYIKLEKIKPQNINMQSILQHDIFTDTKKIDFALIKSQLDLLKENLIKYNNPLKKVILKTRRPTVLKRGDEVYFNVTDIIQDTLKVIDLSEEYIHPNGDIENKPFKEITYTFANYIDDFAQLLSTFQLKDEINKVQLAKKQNFNYTAELIISCTNELNTTNNANFISKPTFVGYEFINVNSEAQNNYLRINWNLVQEANNYYIEISLNNIFTNLISAGNTGNYSSIETYSQFTINNNKFYVRIRAFNQYSTSEWSDTLEITKVNIKNFSNNHNWDLLYNSENMTGSGLSIIDNKNSIVANFYRNTSHNASSAYPTWVNDSVFGNGIKFNSPASALRIADSNIIDTSTKATWLFVIKFNQINIQQFLLNKVSSSNINNNSYQFYIENDNKAKSILRGSNGSYFNNSSSAVLNNSDANVVIGLAFRYDCITNSLIYIKNQNTYNISGISLPSSVSNSPLDLFIGAFLGENGSWYYSNTELKAEIYRIAMIKDTLSESQIKAEFSQMGLT